MCPARIPTTSSRASRSTSKKSLRRWAAPTRSGGGACWHDPGLCGRPGPARPPAAICCLAPARCPAITPFPALTLALPLHAPPLRCCHGLPISPALPRHTGLAPRTAWPHALPGPAHLWPYALAAPGPMHCTSILHALAWHFTLACILHALAWHLTLPCRHTAHA